jgi:hypothetical protein
MEAMEQAKTIQNCSQRVISCPGGKCYLPVSRGKSGFLLCCLVLREEMPFVS